MISKTPNVLHMSMRINHFLWDSLAAFQRAIPFHGIDHKTAMISHTDRLPFRFNNVGSIGAIITKKE